jgi:hypothetical protein
MVSNVELLILSCHKDNSNIANTPVFQDQKDRRLRTEDGRQRTDNGGQKSVSGKKFSVVSVYSVAKK